MPHQNNPIRQDQINPYYQYDAEDVEKILKARINAVMQEIGQQNQLNICVSEPVNLSAGEDQVADLTRILNKEKENKTPRVLLVPCNISSHLLNYSGLWVGLVLEIKHDGSLARAQYVDSSDVSYTVPAEIQNMFAAAYDGVVLQAAPCMKQGADDLVSSGPCLIENLLTVAYGINDQQRQEILVLRMVDIQCFIDHDFDFGNTFLYTKQAIASNNEDQQQSLSVPENISSLFTSMVSIQNNIEYLLSEKPLENHTSAYANMSEQYKAVCDADGVIKLQLRYVGDNRSLTPFLYQPLWRDDKIGFMRDHSNMAVLGVAGVAGSIFNGPGLTAAYNLAREGFKISIKAGLRGGASAFNPATLGVTVAAVTGSYLSEAQSRKFATTIKEALDLYNAAGDDKGDSKLEEAYKKLRDEFENYGLISMTSRTVRWFETSNEQYDFAYLVWAQILAQLQKPEALNIFSQIYATTQNKTFKAMALISQVCMLTNNNTWVGESGKLIKSPEQRKHILDMQVLDLNTNFPEIVHNYLGMAIQAYINLTHIISIQGHTKAFNEFDVLRIKLDAIINFKELHCLRYLQIRGQSVPAGKIAEVVFTFAQALCHIIIKENNTINNQRRNIHVSEEPDDESIAIQERLQECTKLITSFGLWGVSKRSPKLKYILEDIDKYTKLYLSQDASKANQGTQHDQFTYKKHADLKVFKCVIDEVGGYNSSANNTSSWLKSCVVS